MNGLDDFSRRPEDLVVDISRVTAILDRVYTALSDKALSLPLKKFLLSLAVDLEDDRERLSCV